MDGGRQGTQANEQARQAWQVSAKLCRHAQSCCGACLAVAVGAHRPHLQPGAAPPALLDACRLTRKTGSSLIWADLIYTSRGQRDELGGGGGGGAQAGDSREARHGALVTQPACHATCQPALMNSRAAADPPAACCTHPHPPTPTPIHPPACEPSGESLPAPPRPRRRRSGCRRLGPHS